MNIQGHRVNKKNMLHMGRSYLAMLFASFVMAFNISNVARVGGIINGGASGLTLLLQRVADVFFGWNISYTAIYIPLNAIPIYLGFRYVGKKFTANTLFVIVCTSLMVDVMPYLPITEDILLCAVFGGLLNGAAIGICLLSNATSGGTDIISIYISQKYKKDAWNYIFLGNVVVLMISGLLFGIEEALYSIILQYVSTNVIQLIYKRYQKQTLFIITENVDKVYGMIKKVTNHDGTLFKGIGMYKGKERNMIYSVVSSEEMSRVIAAIKRVDEDAFINVMKSTEVKGNFYQKPNM